MLYFVTGFRLFAALSASIIITGCAASAHRPTHARTATVHVASRSTMTITAPAYYSPYSYRGKPDLGLTLAMVEAGGGSAHFNSARLFHVLAGSHEAGESQKLSRLYGKARMAAFMQTFTFAMRDLVTLFKINHVTLPEKPRISPERGRAIVSAIYHDGIMPTGRYDCGYMMEHLMTHPLHVALMHDIDDARGHGAQHNANFHIVLTRMIADLRNLYGSRVQ